MPDPEYDQRLLYARNVGDYMSDCVFRTLAGLPEITFEQFLLSQRKETQPCCSFPKT